jgi:hypothetical protein
MPVNVLPPELGVAGSGAGSFLTKSFINLIYSFSASLFYLNLI